LGESFYSKRFFDDLLKKRDRHSNEFTAKTVREWLGHIGVKSLCIELGNRWEYGYNKILNGMLRDELLNGEVFYTLREAQVIIERRREDYNKGRPA
jgi:transposase InsO family protein